MIFAEAVAMLRRDGYADAADIMEEQAVQICTFRQAMLENTALKKQLKVTMEDLADCRAELNEARQNLSLSESMRGTPDSVIEAHWIYSPCDGAWTTTCSHCGYEETGYYVMHKYKGCPMCRAKMLYIDCDGHRKEIAHAK